MVFIDKSSGKPYYEQLMLGIKEEIVSGILKPGDQLLSVREMSRELTMNPNTVSKAYKLLEAQDVIITVKGKGTFVKALTTEMDPKSVEKIQRQLSELTIEAYYQNISSEELKRWVEDSYKKIKGEHT
ncbi:GntR family transcriptional regulator [Enterococcus sp. BWR-S5]|uniref:GntR family transcriptional regulator n=1 Tax=Enterococcus sp. BWR-S5 TaxID=2787714 RepID=UPI001923761F|nr:GntR family transcriptional regulator [Enterococcus sp. BWR-S5]MBL1224432.1 GntR family transcriptional regulator [Enterococcus sp. BWR-S5]